MPIALPRASLTTTNRPLEFLLHYLPQLDINPPYQRGVVWGVERKRALWFSLLSGIPIPALVINDRLTAEFPDTGDDSDRWFSIVDGKQRISAITGFLLGEFSLDGAWFSDFETGNPMKGWTFHSDLDLPTQRRLKHLTIGVCEGQLSSMDAERELFELVNFGGLAQGEVDLDLVASGRAFDESIPIEVNRTPEERTS
ncbi:MULTISPECIES: DUF262 domain-containing protein [Nocardiaceae]|uniref:DUF262 domain-containing protein n=1 Tax=Nocardiaceae TaxID=85025 RepID=UPI000709A4B7|nr:MULTISPECIES: DUF262 domain-containing protein [Rhodococcus]KQU35709.1 hypothetical protein ASH04_23845 [Rhodococcus sp. Leaf233]MBP2527463.1 hypothetical protein [Rhodococcus sp. PvP104]WQH31317.1 DUF262 domain-containing protein [Rhodococcus fascians]